jgi:hypothetical protein
MPRAIKRVKINKFPSGTGWQASFHRCGHNRMRQTFETRLLAQAVSRATACGALTACRLSLTSSSVI